MGKLFFIALLCCAIINSACSNGSSQGQEPQSENYTEGLFAVQIEQYPVKILDIIINSPMTEEEINNFKSILSRRLSSLVARERISKSYNHLIEDINNKFYGKIIADKKPDGIRIKLIEIEKNSSKKDIHKKLKKIQNEIFEFYPFLDEEVFEKYRDFAIRKLDMTAILSFKISDQKKIIDQTIQQYITYFKNRIVQNGKDLLRIQVPVLNIEDSYLERFLCDSGYLSISEINAKQTSKDRQETLPLKVSDRIKDKIPPQSLNVVKIEELNRLIASAGIEKDSRFDAWYVTVQLSDEGVQFYKNATARLMSKRVAFVLDSGISGKEIISAQVIREINKKGNFTLPVNSFYEAQNLRDILSWGAYIRPVIRSSLSEP